MHLLNKHFRREQRDSDEAEDLILVRLPLVRGVRYPHHRRLEDRVLRIHIEVVAAEDFFQLGKVQPEKLLSFYDGMKVLHYLLGSLAVELLESVYLGESLDANTIERVDLSLHELTAGVADAVNLKQAGGLEKQLHRLDGDSQHSTVAVIDHCFHRRGIHVKNGNRLHARLREVAGEHGTEVRAGSSKNVSVSSD